MLESVDSSGTRTAHSLKINVKQAFSSGGNSEVRGVPVKRAKIPLLIFFLIYFLFEEVVNFRVF